MTSTIKRRIAREWLIFLACIVIGLTVIYFRFYYGLHSGYARYSDAKYLNPGDLLNDLLTPDHGYFDLNRLTIWLYVLSPYPAVLFARSLIWSVNTFRRH
jgi:hypothetical protein